jgi:hypothetical protein
MHFRIFIPNINTTNKTHLDKVGLGHLYPGAVFVPGAVDGVRGMILQWCGEPVADVDGWRWVDSLTPGQYQVGFASELPQPHELKWPKRFGGHFVTLGDSNSWCIPAAGQLPQSLTMGADKRAVRTVRAEFRSYFDDSAKWFVDLLSRDFDEPVQTYDTEVFEYLSRALGLNYRLTPEVVNELGLFGSDNLIECLQASIDGLAINEELANQKLDQKKSELQPAG